MKAFLIVFGWGVFYAIVSVIATFWIRHSLAQWASILVAIPFLIGALAALSGRVFLSETDPSFWKFRAPGWSAFVGCVGLGVFMIGSTLMIGPSLMILWLLATLMLAALPITMIAAHLGGYLALHVHESYVQ